MDLYEREDLKDFLITLYGDQVKKWHMNETLFHLTYVLVAESGRCSGLVDLVPRPMPPGANAYKYISKEIRGIFLRTLKQNKKHYVMRTKNVARLMKNQFHMAALGV